jgi:pimeloyl-ACP methyl ester carboxylesterase
MPVFEERTRTEPLEAVQRAERAHELQPGNDTLRDIAVASAPWNFTSAGIDTGTELLGRMPYNLAAVEWSARSFDTTYRASWWPSELPTLIVSGDEDRIVVQHLWDDARFAGPHVLHRHIPEAAHWPWIENPAAVAAAFDELLERLEGPA